MSDLISRSELLKLINNKYIGLNDAVDLYHGGIFDCFKEIKLMIKKQPTAYDIDKVIEELEKNASRYTKKYITPYGNNGYKDTKAISIHKAIEIVKHGCVSDDVCEPSADKIKVTSLDVIVTGSKRKPYYEIKYKEVGTDNYNIGYSSYNLDFVLDWKEKCFELVKVVE